MSSLSHFPALVLNADFRPLSYNPLSTLGWQDAVKGVYEGTHQVVAEYDRAVRSPSIEMMLPSVLMVRSYVKPRGMNKPASFQRFALFLAYSFRCQLCGEQFPTTELTFEHIVPSSRGGGTDWDNVVPACSPCNNRKGNKTLKEAKMRLIRDPYHPTRGRLEHLAKTLQVYEDRYRGCFRSWNDVLYWNVNLETSDTVKGSA
jgi:5-methylcytosine-specific restriction endonuclease McrA